MSSKYTHLDAVARKNSSAYGGLHCIDKLVLNDGVDAYDTVKGQMGGDSILVPLIEYGYLTFVNTNLPVELQVTQAGSNLLFVNANTFTLQYDVITDVLVGNNPVRTASKKGEEFSDLFLRFVVGAGILSDEQYGIFTHKQQGGGSFGAYLEQKLASTDFDDESYAIDEDFAIWLIHVENVYGSSVPTDLFTATACFSFYHSLPTSIGGVPVEASSNHDMVYLGQGGQFGGAGAYGFFDNELEGLTPDFFEYLGNNGQSIDPAIFDTDAGDQLFDGLGGLLDGFTDLF